jgi:hypothetical protein
MVACRADPGWPGGWLREWGSTVHAVSVVSGVVRAANDAVPKPKQESSRNLPILPHGLPNKSLCRYMDALLHGWRMRDFREGFS